MSRDRAAGLLMTLSFLLLALPVCSGSSSGGGGGDPCNPPSVDTALGATRTYRGIAGVSMGGYGALNLGTKHQDMFGMIGSMGGPVDLWQLLIDIRDDNLEVKIHPGPLPMDVGDDFTFDLLPPYPDRGTRITFTKDLVLAFGNPLLHHDPLAANVYLASTSQPALIRRDDQWGLTGQFQLPPDPPGFSDGGDDDEDGLRQTSELTGDENAHPLLVAAGSLESVLGVTTGIVDVEGRSLADTDSDGIFDVGDGIVVNTWEPFTDTNGNGMWDPGEPFSNFGLDGINGTGDFGEGTPAEWDWDPDIDNWLAEDPLTRIMGMSNAQILSQRIYMDAGDADELDFLLHHQNVVDEIESRGILFETISDLSDSYCNPLNFPDIDDPYTFFIYEGGHVGFDTEELRDDLRNGSVDVCGAAAIWQRLIHLLAAADAAFPDGEDDAAAVGDTLTCPISSPALALPGGAAPERTVVIYRPPAFHTGDASLPILYFLGGHGQKPEDYERINVLMDILIGTGLVQNMFVAFLPGDGGTEGSFYVNHVVPESQVPDVPVPVTDTSGAYEDSIFQDLIPRIERVILRDRVRR